MGDREGFFVAQQIALGVQSIKGENCEAPCMAPPFDITHSSLDEEFFMALVDKLGKYITLDEKMLHFEHTQIDNGKI